MEERANVLRAMEICRFCLDDKGPLTNIYEKDGSGRDAKHSVALPLQIMACVAIEVFQNDGMPQLICDTCRSHTNQAYVFKSTCKKSDDALKLFLATGNIHILKEQFNPDYYHSSLKLPKSAKVKSEVKKIKSENVVMLNNVLEDPTNPIKSDEHAMEIEENENINEEIIEEASDNDEDDDDDDDDDDHEMKINPILKVPQVQTDVFPCQYCERSFPLKQLLDLHIKNHTRERSYACSQCGRKFFTKYDLGKHIQTHSSDRPFTCVVCHKQFARESLLHRHEKTHIDVPKYLCSSCDRTFLSRGDLDAHSEKHKKKRPFSCRICKKSFVFKQGLERHEVTHSEEKPHKCNYCEASFTSPIKLMRHITSHAGLRPYPCKLCGRTFLLSHHLTRHMRSHYAAKNAEAQPIGQHKCDICSMSFRRKDSLINHSTIHSMVNLKCVICNTGFDNAKQVMNHITTHLSGLPYPCDKCDYSFDTQDQLEEHEIKHAEMEYEDQIEQEVHLEATQSASSSNQQVKDDDDDADYSGDDVTEFTITNAESAEIAQRPRRATKIKNYAQFLKEELGSDVEEELIQEDEEPAEITPDIREPEEQVIKPIVRIEGTKVYARKNMSEKPRVIPDVNIPCAQIAQPEQINQRITTLENLGLTKQAVNALPNKQFVDVKIGDKTVRVQKLMMTKAEIDAMARQGKIEIKGDTILLKKMVEKAPPIRHTMETIIDDVSRSAIQKPVVKKTYMKRINPDSSQDKQEAAQVVEEHGKK